ncbi:hypothetical protein [Oceanithermus sp.]
MEVRKIPGYGGRELRVSLEGAAGGRLALVFPGLRYPPAAPLLYYSRKLLLSRGWAVASVWYEYDTPAFADASEAGRFEWIASEAGLFWNWAREQGRAELALGKSLGTLAMAHLSGASPAFYRLARVWLTPLLASDAVASAIAASKSPELLVAGAADPATPPELLARLERPGRHLLVLPEADHSLETADVFQTLSLLNDYLLALDAFLESL